MAPGPDRLSMATTPTEQVMAKLSAVGADLVAGWSAAASDVTATAGQLGRGPLGEAFLQGYRGHADEVAQLADICCRKPAELADAGKQSVGEYAAADTLLAQAFERLSALRKA